MGLWTRKGMEIKEGTHLLKRALGPWDLIMLGIGAIIGAGLFSITGIAAAEHAGPAIVISFLLAGLVCAFSGLCYSELASMIPASGSAYTYAYAAFGEFIAWLLGWTLILEYAVGAVVVSISWSAYVTSLLSDFGIVLPTEIIASPWHSTSYTNPTEMHGWINLPAIFIVVILSFLLIVGVKESATVNSWIVKIKVAVVLLFIAVGLFYIDWNNLSPFIPKNEGEFGVFGWSGIFRAAAIIFFAYIGFDAVSTSAQETINPQKNLPVGILGSLIICTILYVLFGFVMTGVSNYRELNVAAPIAVPIAKMHLFWLEDLIKIAVLAGLTSVILVMLYGQSRIFYAMAKDGMLPSIFSSLHPRFATPWWSNIILMIFVGTIAAFAPLTVIASMTSIGTLLAFLLVCTGVLVLRYTHPEFPRPFKTPWVPFVPIAGIISCLMLMVSLEEETWLRLLIWLIIGLGIYFGFSRRNISGLKQ